jgi:phage virion morphogenesis protein
MKVTIDGLGTLQKRLDGIRDRLENPRPFLETCAEILAKSAGKTFDAQGRPKWVDRKDDLTHPILDRTGRMRDSMEMTTETGDAVVRYTIGSREAFLEKGTAVEYGQYHQFGKGVPKRQFVEFTTEDIEEIRKDAREYFWDIDL